METIAPEVDSELQFYDMKPRYHHQGGTCTISLLSYKTFMTN